VAQGAVRHHLGRDEASSVRDASSGDLNHDASAESTRDTKRRSTDRWTRWRCGGDVGHLISRCCNMHVYCGYILWWVCELAAGMIKFELFGPISTSLGRFRLLGRCLGDTAGKPSPPCS
jgi:hypothetical protein